MSQRGTALQHTGFPFLLESVCCRAQRHFFSTEEGAQPPAEGALKSAAGLVEAPGWARAQKSTEGNV